MSRYDDAPADLVAEVYAERARYRRMRHFCMECLGRTGPGSPCFEPEPEEEQEE